MKFEWFRLKKWWIKHGHTMCPIGVETSQWDTLVAYWFECAAKKRNDQLMGARGVIMKVSKYGRGGKAMAEHKLVTHCLPIMLWDVWCNGQFVLQFINYSPMPKVWCVAEIGISSKPIIV
jgi:hypothetical protein